MNACVEETSTAYGRRLWWTTKPDACGRRPSRCGLGFCGKPGLALQDGQIDATQWIQGLLLNMIGTDARREPNECGIRPEDVRGHWSETFIDDSVGTHVRDLGVQFDIERTQQLVQQNLTETALKLVDRGVAQDVEVTVAYTGEGRFRATINVIGQNQNSARVSFSGSRLQNGWVWENGL